MWRQRHRLLLSILVPTCVLALTAGGQARGADPAAPSVSHKVDLNTATPEQLQTLPGIGEATARKIIAGRPYKSVDELRKAGVPQASVDKIKGLATTGPPARTAEPGPIHAGKTGANKVNVNTATAEQLQTLPGIGEATARKIIAGRPYKSVDDLLRAGVPKATLDKIRDTVTVRSTAEAAGKANNLPRKIDLNTASVAELRRVPGIDETTARKIIASRPYQSVDQLAKAGVPRASIERLRNEVTVRPSPEHKRINLNTASPKELQELPGVGEATATKIVAGRPYKSVDELAKAGVPQSTIEKLRTNVTVEASPTRTGKAGAAAAGGRERESTVGQAKVAPKPAQPGMVWVNTESGVFHRENSRWYGKTQQGKYMTEADALKAGYREAKND